MKNIINTMFLALAIIFSSCLNGEKSISDEFGYKLVWSDEFDENGGLDPLNWNYELGFVRNEELQLYTNSNAYCENGLLVIEGRKETVKNPHFDEQSGHWKYSRKEAKYTASSVTSRGLREWTYGRFEIKAKIPTMNGMWPAIWTLGSNGSWPHNGEIDIMEHYRGMILANVAWGSHKGDSAVWNDTRTPLSEFGEGWANEFHIWRMDWTKESISLYVDDQLLNYVDLKTTMNQDGSGNPFHGPQYLLLNLAIGGTQGGDPSATIFPVKYEIEYVRVYQKEGKSNSLLGGISTK